jgi:hypothetical protein
VKPDGSAFDFAGSISGTVEGSGIAVDSSGSAYVTGTAHESWAQRGSLDAFAIKIEPVGSRFDYRVLISPGIGAGVAVDSAGNAYLTGGTRIDTPNSILFDAFIAKLDPSGAEVYKNLLSGSGNLNIGAGIAVDGSHNAYVAGWTNSTDFPTVNPLFGTYGGGNSDPFIAKVSDT